MKSTRRTPWRLQKPNHASHLTVGGSWYQCVHCLNLTHSQRGKVCSTNCTKQLSTLYWTHDMTHQLKLNNFAGCMGKRSLLYRCPTYITSALGGSERSTSQPGRFTLRKDQTPVEEEAGWVPQRRSRQFAEKKIKYHMYSPLSYTFFRREVKYRTKKVLCPSDKMVFDSVQSRPF